MKNKIAIIGSGNVGGALQRGLSKAGYEARTSNASDAKEKAGWGEIVLLAVPFGAIEAVTREIGSAVNGKTVIDATNALTPDMKLALGYSTSGAEELQKRLSSARVVKCFNTVFAQHMDTGRTGDQQLTVFAASDDEASRKSVLAIARDIGFDAVDGGPLSNARHLEALGYFNIQLGYVLEMGTQIGFKLLHT